MLLIDAWAVMSLCKAFSSSSKADLPQLKKSQCALTNRSQMTEMIETEPQKLKEKKRECQRLWTKSTANCHLSKRVGQRCQHLELQLQPEAALPFIAVVTADGFPILCGSPFTWTVQLSDKLVQIHQSDNIQGRAWKCFWIAPHIRSLVQSFPGMTHRSSLNFRQKILAEVQHWCQPCHMQSA